MGSFILKHVSNQGWMLPGSGTLEGFMLTKIYRTSSIYQQDVNTKSLSPVQSTRLRRLFGQFMVQFDDYLSQRNFFEIEIHMSKILWMQIFLLLEIFL